MPTLINPTAGVTGIKPIDHIPPTHKNAVEAEHRTVKPTIQSVDTNNIDSFEISFAAAALGKEDATVAEEKPDNANVSMQKTQPLSGINIVSGERFTKGVDPATGLMVYKNVDESDARAPVDFQMPPQGTLVNQQA